MAMVIAMAMAIMAIQVAPPSEYATIHGELRGSSSQGVDLARVQGPEHRRRRRGARGARAPPLKFGKNIFQAIII